jgi:hypothetical protein
MIDHVVIIPELIRGVADGSRGYTTFEMKGFG